MATFGARHSRWAPFAAETPDGDKQKIPKYGTVEDLGELNKANDELNFAEGSLPGDDRIALYEKQFKDGKLTVNSVCLPLATAAKILGCSVDETNGLAFSDDDKPPYGGYSCITQHVGGGKHYWQAVFYPMCKSMGPGNSSYATRGDNLTFNTDNLEFHVESPLSRKYKIIKDFDTEAAAEAYIDGLYAGTSPVPGLTGVAAAAVQKGKTAAEPKSGTEDKA